jgi:hypothetical protein
MLPKSWTSASFGGPDGEPVVDLDYADRAPFLRDPSRRRSTGGERHRPERPDVATRHANQPSASRMALRTTSLPGSAT